MKWTPVHRLELRKNKEIEPFRVSVKCGKLLKRTAAAVADRKFRFYHRNARRRQFAGCRDQLQKPFDRESCQDIDLIAHARQRRAQEFAHFKIVEADQRDIVTAETLGRAPVAVNGVGTDGADLIFGSNEDDTLAGGDGDDIIMSFAGNDQVQGDAGDDTFVFTSTTVEVDILDYEAGIDQILLQDNMSVAEVNEIDIGADGVIDAMELVLSNGGRVVLAGQTDFLDPVLTVDTVARTAAVKARIVTEDERETSGLRSLLNYGHTIGHGLETATEYGSLLHGEAVAIGMTAAVRISRDMGLIDDDVVSRQDKALKLYGLPTRMPGADREAIRRAMSVDKKTTAGNIRWVLLEEVGRSTVRGDVPQDVVRQALLRLREDT